MDTEQVDHFLRKYGDLCKKARISPYAEGALKALEGEEVAIVGIDSSEGGVSSYTIKHEGQHYTAEPEAVYIDDYTLEDTHADTDLAVEIQQHMKRWAKPHDYWGPTWEGIELFHFELAFMTQSVAVESAGWYRYPSSNRDNMDGKDWRLVVPGSPDPVAVNCHSVLHDDVWTLATTIYSTKDIDEDRLHLVEHEDHWVRALMWTVHVAKALEEDGYDYSEPIEDMMTRLEAIYDLRVLLNEIQLDVADEYRHLKGEEPNFPEFISIGASAAPIRPQSIASLHHPIEDGFSEAVLTIHPRALDNEGFVRNIIKHELIHAAVGPSEERDHNEFFQEMAFRLGIPEEHWD